MAQVTLRKVVKMYDEVQAVRGIDLDITDKEFIVLVGPSGCGKSTTLRMIAGLEEISGGDIAIGGDVVNDVPPKDRDIAMVFQNYALYPHMNVYENMSFGLKLKRTPTSGGRADAVGSLAPRRHQCDGVRACPARPRRGPGVGGAGHHGEDLLVRVLESPTTRPTGRPRWGEGARTPSGERPPVEKCAVRRDVAGGDPPCHDRHRRSWPW